MSEVKSRSSSLDDSHHAIVAEDSHTKASSKDFKMKMRSRPWSMLDLREMEVIHKLEDDMQDILSIEEDEAHTSPFTPSRNPSPASKTTITQPSMQNLPRGSGSSLGNEMVGLASLDEDNANNDDDDDDFMFYDQEGEENMNGACNIMNTGINFLSSQSRPGSAPTSARTLKLITRSTTPGLAEPSNEDILAQDKIKLPTIEEDDSSKKKLKKNIFKRIGMKKSISMGMFSKHWNYDGDKKTLDVSHHRRTEALSLDLDCDEEHSECSEADPKKNAGVDCQGVLNNEHNNELDNHGTANADSLGKEMIKTSLDDSSHGRRIDLDGPTHSGSLHFSLEDKIVSPKSPSPNYVANISPLEDLPILPTSSLNPGSLDDDHSGSFKHCPKKKPVQSILRKTTSMHDLSSQSNLLSNSSSSPTNSVNNNPQNMKRTTSFSTLEIREYKITIGDNPGGRNGPPISLDWNYCERSTVKMCIDKYEKLRPPRRERHEMYMPGKIRMWTLLKELGYSLREIDAASKAADTIRKKRHKSIKYKGIHELQYKMAKIMRLGGGGSGGGRSATQVIV